jgi:hypothetical protein
MRHTPFIKIGIAVLVFFMHFSAEAQLKLTLTGTPPVLNISTGTYNTQPQDATNSLCQIRYKTPNTSYTYKITIQTDCSTPHFKLTATASAVSDGSSAGTVSLDNTNVQNFITNIPAFKGNAFATIDYVASALYSQGNSSEWGPDIHKITYTILQSP